jgi:HK97 family phage prohead protease
LNISGYAVKWADRADIHDRYLGRHSERVRRGAFARSIADRVPQILYGHGHGALSDMPVAKVLTIGEDDIGLRFEARMLEGVPSLLEAGVKEGLYRCSIGFRIEADSWDESGDRPERTLESVQLREVSLVTFPAYAQTPVGPATEETPRSQPMTRPREALFGTPAWQLEDLRRKSLGRVEGRTGRAVSASVVHPRGGASLPPRAT